MITFNLACKIEDRLHLGTFRSPTEGKGKYSNKFNFVEFLMAASSTPRGN